MAATLTRYLGEVIDAAVAHSGLRGFTPLDGRDGATLRRYYAGEHALERELALYRDKHWSRAGGRVQVELFCLAAEVQSALGGCRQSWRAPDYTKPLLAFQYRTGRDARDTSHRITDRDSADAFAAWLSGFLDATALPWFAGFDTAQGIADYLTRETRFHALARWRAWRGERQAAHAALRDYLLALPRQIEAELDQLQAAGLLEQSDRKVLLRASLQSEADYARAVRAWLQRAPRA